jgi:hypothetical protein
MQIRSILLGFVSGVAIMLGLAVWIHHARLKAAAAAQSTTPTNTPSNVAADAAWLPDFWS